MGSNERWLCGLVGIAFLALAGTALAKPPVGFSPPGLQSHPNHSNGPFSSGTTFGTTNTHAPVGVPPGCDTEEVMAAVALAKFTIDQECPCAGSVSEGELGTVPWKNHGQYVSCVAKASQSAGVPPPCLADVVPCAAQSTCGKTDDFACITTTPGVCMADQTCDTNGLHCEDDSDCPPQQSCAMMTEGDCQAIGNIDEGVVMGTGNCCSFSPSPDLTLAPVSGSLTAP